MRTWKQAPLNLKRLAPGKNQSLFREVNERVAGSMDLWVEDGLFCECGHDTCFERIAISHEEYEAIRSHPRHFFVAPSDQHFIPTAEDVVDRNERSGWSRNEIGTVPLKSLIPVPAGHGRRSRSIPCSAAVGDTQPQRSLGGQREITPVSQAVFSNSQLMGGAQLLSPKELVEVPAKAA